jgi:hypothetical protein
LLPIVFTSLYASYSDIFPPVAESSGTTQGSDTGMQNDQSYY